MNHYEHNADFNTLIPELKLWNAGGGADIDTFQCGRGSYELLIAFGRLFWPEFIEHDGCVFFKSKFTVDSYNEWMKTCDGDRTAVEVVFNHEHIVDMFGASPDPEPKRDVVIYCGRMLREIWQTKVDAEFRDRRIVVDFNDDEDPTEGLLSYEITVFTER
jgi:hypothetical protein